MFKAYAFGIPLGGHCHGRSRWGWGFDGFASEFWGPKGGGRHHRGRMGRVFEQGDLKYVILRLLDEKPRHGYEIIKELEDRFGGAYSPSPGTVYPTLTMLEDLGYAKVTQDEKGRKTYGITAEGKSYLEENSSTVDSIFERIGRFMEGFLDAPMMEVNASFRKVARLAYGHAAQHVNDRKRLNEIKQILDRAAAELDQLGRKGGAGGEDG